MVHEWVGQFRSETVHFKMTSVCGHVMSLDFIGKYNSWDKVDPVSSSTLHRWFCNFFLHFKIELIQVELFSCPTEKKEANAKLRIPQLLGKEGSNCDYLILWLDCDKEGENICFEVITAVQQGSSRRLGDEVK